MALLLQVKNSGNQLFRSAYNNNLYEWVIQWNSRNSRFYLGITNISTGVTIDDQSIEPFSTMDLSGLDFNSLYLLPILSTSVYDSSGAYDIKYSDIGTNLKLVLVTINEITELKKTYGAITILS